MPVDETIIAVFDEGGTGSISFVLTGFNGEVVTPNTLLWTLSDTSGNIINSREDVEGTPAETNWVDLQGDDLVVDDDSNTIRVVTVKGTMDITRDGEPLLNTPYTLETRINILLRVNI